MNNLIDSLNELEEIKQFKRLEKIVENDKTLFEKLQKIYDLQKQLVNSKHYNLENNYKNILVEYESLKKDLEDNIIVDMYLNSLEEVNDILNNITSIIKNNIDEKLL